ncbi:class I SAM-dependent methyltransferase [Christiangramia sediminis]|uniref:Class I SAM-dependent methyltransferase n=1 Tax=Christiangramia sediminis TaxID=2881336 RepID=A0A9X1RZ48_9FLAO|nr:class I SAM-dependent methyltransferase [Christiangramia sediminis]MCB7482464.1 class I SAM-dependent methyltransferase [Christiangramia sediminis]
MILPVKIRSFLKRYKEKMISLAKNPVKEKEQHELHYWKVRKEEEVLLTNDHYKLFYTDHFKISESFYSEKNLLDVGCGPRGSLEWAHMASKRVGLDPLANEYLKLGADQHKMQYVNSNSERMPFKNNTFDAVFSFNSLDHVINVEKTLKEVTRVLRPGGIFLLLVEVNHPPKPCEPHSISPRDLMEFLQSDFDKEELKVYYPVKEEGMYQSIRENKLISDPQNTKEVGWMSVKFTKKKN